MKKEGGTEEERKGGQERKRKKRKLLLIVALLAVVGVGAIAGIPYYKGWYEKYEKWKEKKEFEEGIKELKSIQENGNIPLGKTLEEVKELIDLSEYRQEKDRSGESIYFYAPKEEGSIEEIWYNFYQNPSIPEQYVLGTVGIYGIEYDYLEVYGIRIGGRVKEARKELEKRGYKMNYAMIEGKEASNLEKPTEDWISYEKGGVEVLIVIRWKDSIASIIWMLDWKTIEESRKRRERER